MPVMGPGIGGPQSRGPRFGGPRIEDASGYIFTLTGTVYDASLTPVPGAFVELFDDTTCMFIARTVADANGVYTFHPPTNSPTYRINARHPSNVKLAGIGEGLTAS